MNKVRGLFLLGILGFSGCYPAFADTTYSKDQNGNVIKTETSVVGTKELNDIIANTQATIKRKSDQIVFIQSQISDFTLAISTSQMTVQKLGDDIIGLQALLNQLSGMK